MSATAVNTRDSQTPQVQNKLEVHGDLDVVHKLSANTCEFGVEHCKITVTNEDNIERLKFTLPTSGKDTTNITSQEYDMRSIIESIQELNRRTATLNCNVSFLSAMETFDTSANPNDMFACDQDVDGLPAARMGDVNLPNSNSEKQKNDVTFTDGRYTEGLWTYALDELGLYIEVSISEDAKNDIFKGEVVLNGDNMPYERINSVPVRSYRGLFDGLSEITTISINDWTNKNIRSMQDMFSNMSNCTTITLESFNTSDVRSMQGMFYNNIDNNGNPVTNNKLESIIFGNSFDTSNVVSMESMFTGNNKLSELIFPSYFNTRSYPTMVAMFRSCTSLKTLIFSPEFTIQSNKHGNPRFPTDRPPCLVMFNNLSSLTYISANSDTIKLLKSETCASWDTTGHDCGKTNHTHLSIGSWSETGVNEKDPYTLNIHYSN